MTVGRRLLLAVKCMGGLDELVWLDVREVEGGGAGQASRGNG